MKLIKTCPMIIFIAAITIILSVTSYALEGGVYSEYAATYQADKAPHFILVFKGLSDGVYPWSQSFVSEGEDLLADADISPNEGGEEASLVSENGEKEIFVAGEHMVGRTVSGNGVSDNSVSGNSVSDNSLWEDESEKTYEFTEVDEDYFTDALFIGDSRTVGLSEYCQPLDERATFYAKVSLTIYGVMDKPFIKKGDSNISVEKALSENQFGKIYIMLGLNEMGTGTVETFAEEYSKVIDRIRELQPDALIFIQGIMHVTEKKSRTDKYFTNERIDERNQALSELADNQTIFYMDMNEAVDDENGNLLAELTFDDVHLKASSYQRWYDFLLGHGIIK